MAILLLDYVIDICTKIHLQRKVEVVYVADRLSKSIRKSGIKKIIVPSGSGKTDDEIIKNASAKDILITSDLYPCREAVK